MDNHHPNQSQLVPFSDTRGRKKDTFRFHFARHPFQVGRKSPQLNTPSSIDYRRCITSFFLRIIFGWSNVCLIQKCAIHHFRPYQILTPWSFTGSFCPKTHVRISSPHILFHHYLPARQLPIRCIFHAGRHLSDKEICYLGTITVMADVSKKVPFVRV